MPGVEQQLHQVEPVPLAKANLLRPFVYSRAMGVLYVPAGQHQVVMARLNERTGASGIRELDVCDLADEWLETTPGAAFRSSVSNCIMIGARSALSHVERRMFQMAGELRVL